MLISRPDIMPGRVFFLEHESTVLQNNPLQDPTRRLHPVWLPPDYEAKVKTGKRFPLVFELAGYLGSGLGRIAWRPFDENIIDRLNRLHHEQKIPDVIVVFPDGFTKLGGNQYINSSAIGRYGDFINLELLDLVDQSLATIQEPQERTIYGKSSGGYGALLAAMLYPGHWGNVGVIAADSYFDALYRNDWHNTLTQLAKFAPQPLIAEKANRPGAQSEGLLQEGIDDGRVNGFLQSILNNERPSHSESHALMNLCMAATYDPDSSVPNGFRLPFHAYTGELIVERWQQWLKWDPVKLVGQHQATLQSLNNLYLDCGWNDQYQIHYGMRQLSLQLDRLDVPHTYREFSGTHSGIDYRIDNLLVTLLKKG